MARKPSGRKQSKPEPRAKLPADQAPAGDGASTVRARKLAPEDAWELVHPRCAQERAEDLQEVQKMVAAGEIDVARDECRWLLEGCTDCLEAHRLLGQIALGENDLPLARGHFGYAYRLGTQAIERSGAGGPWPHRLPANRSFFESAAGLIRCLIELDKPEMAEEVVAFILRCDPGDPLGLRGCPGQQGASSDG